MARGLILAVWDDEAFLNIQAEAQQGSVVVGQLRQNTQIEILDQQGNLIQEADMEGQSNLLTEIWFQVRGEDVDGQPIEGWTPETRVRVREEDDSGTPLAGTVRRKLGSGADPLTDVYAESNENSAVIGRLEASVRVEIIDQATLDILLAELSPLSSFPTQAEFDFLVALIDETRAVLSRIEVPPIQEDWMRERDRFSDFLDDFEREIVILRFWDIIWVGEWDKAVEYASAPPRLGEALQETEKGKGGVVDADVSQAHDPLYVVVFEAGIHQYQFMGLKPDLGKWLLLSGR